MQSVIRFFVQHRLFANLFTLMVIGMGLLTATRIQREAFPVVDFEVVLVVTLWPGASPAEVERLISIPLEQEIKGVDGIKSMGSVSVESRSVLILQLDPDLTKKKQSDTVDSIKLAVDRVQDLPDDVDRPWVEEISSEQMPIIEVNLSGPDELELRKHAKELEERFLDVKGVASIAKRGWRERQILVEVKPENLREFHISLAEVAQALAGRNINLPGGKIKRGGDEWLVRAVGEFEGIEDIKPVIIRANELGRWVQVEDVAEVREGFQELTVINRSRGQRSIDLVVIKKASGDVIGTVDGIREVVEAYRSQLPEGTEIAFTDDWSYYVKRRLGVLTNNAKIGFVLVILALLVFLSTRVSFWTSLGIPFSLLGALYMMDAIGMRLNLISMMGFIIVIGMLVDDAVVVAENIFRYREKGFSPEDASVKGASDVAWPVAGAVLTTMAAFLPLAFMGGIGGKFVWAIPAVVCLALAASWTESMIALPAHLAHKSRWQSKRSKRKGPSRFSKVADWYAEVFTTRLLRWRYLVALATVGMVVGAAFLARTMKVDIFPSSGIEVFMVRADGMTGTPLETTEKMFRPIEKILQALPEEELDTFTTQIGIQQQDPNDPFTRRGSHYAQAKVYLHPTKNRDRTADEIIESVREAIGQDHGFDRIYFTRFSPGPPVGKGVSLRFSAEDFETLKKVDRMVRDEMVKVKGIVDIETDLEAGKKELRVRVNDGAAAEAGVSAAQIALAVRASFEGVVATRIRTLDEEIDIKVLFPEARRHQGKDILDEVLVRNRMGYLVPLSTLADVTEDVGFINIKHSEGKRAVTVTADLEEGGLTSMEANQILRPIIAKRLKEEYPDVTMDVTGEFEQTVEMFSELGFAFIKAIALIFLITASVLGSLLQPLLVLLTVPVALPGVILAFYLHNMPLSFFTGLGAVGLAGVVVNNAIVFISFANKARKQGMAKRASIIEAARIRLRPILLTSITTLFGLMPTAYGIGGDDPFVRPMALALGWGVAFSLVMTLLVLPSLVHISDDVTNGSDAIRRWFGVHLMGWKPVEESSPATGEEGSDPEAA